MMDHPHDRSHSWTSCAVRMAACALLCFVTFGTAASAADEKAGSVANPEQTKFFNEKVKPLLDANCIKCHGGEKKIRGGLMLTSRGGLIKGGDFGSAINFDKLEASLLLEMISYRDDDHQMPPKGKLTDDEIATLTRWVKMGIPWPGDDGSVPKHTDPKVDPLVAGKDWWAYQKVTRPWTPPVKDKAWVTNPIDAFILSKLEKNGLHPVKPAEKIALLRRAYFDLIGLPPTPEEVEAFVADKSPQAYEKVIDRLLAMPQYGEKWGRHWLDLVRYAETNGYERDGTKPYAWRYRDYVIDAFNKDKPYDQFLIEQLAGDEVENPTAETITATGYYRLGIWDDEPADRPQAKYDVLDDVVSTTSQVMLGMTIGCARCHDHKGDPIPQSDYYRILAFMHDVTDYGNNAVVDVMSPADQAAFDADAKQRDAKRAQLQTQIAAMEKQFLDSAEKAGDKFRVLLAKQPDAVQTIAPDSREKGQQWRYTTTKPEGEWHAQAYDDASWKRGPGGFGNAGTPGAVVRTEWGTSDIWLRRNFRLTEIPKSLTLRIHHDEDAEVYLNGNLVASLKGHVRDYFSIVLDVKPEMVVHTGSNAIAVHCKQTGGGQYIDVGITDQADPVTVTKLIQEHGAKHLGAAGFKQYQSFVSELVQVDKAPPPSSVMKVLAVREQGRAQTHVLLRGSAHAKGDQVVPGFPKVLGFADPKIPDAARAGSSGKRTILAQWITSKDNQLTARVMANRLWQFHFGRGIQRTTNDFGKFGERPTHPELLDWLAAELMEGDWKLKRMHKLIMLSSAYRMSSADDSAGLQKDPGNDLFWRFDMRRLGAEEVRDAILAVNGTLNLKMAGPSIYTEVPAAVLQTASRPSAAWGRSSPEDQRRRSVYIFIKRSLVEPIMSTFDVADTDSSCAVRFTTTVPTQALTSLNSDFFNKQAALLAERLKKEAGESVREQIRLGLRLVTSRQPSDNEIDRAMTLYTELQQKDGLSAADAMKYVCLVMLNLNEFVYLD